jgi:RNA polymerase sigma-70 factor, ECF subfamily
MCDLAYNIVRDRDAAKDIVQDVFFRFWKNINHLELTGQIGNYLSKATAHTALNYLRNNRRIFKLDADLLVNTLTAPADSTSAEFSELELRVREAIDRLPPRCKTIYILSRHEGLKYTQIAETLGLSLKTIENQMSIALDKLRTDLKPYLTPELMLILAAIGAAFLWRILRIGELIF